MKSLFKIALSILMMHFTCLAFSQRQEELRKFEINRQKEVETVKTDGVLKRKSDGAVLHISGISERISGNTPEEIAKNYLTRKWSDLGFTSLPEQDVRIDEVKQLNSGTVVRFRQYYQGLRVDKNEVILKLNRRNFVRSLQNSTVPIGTRLSIKPKKTEGEAASAVKKHLTLREEPSFLKTELMVHIVNLHPVLCWQINLVPKVASADWECFVDASTGKIVEIRNTLCSIDGTGNVFNPTPTYSAGVPYGTGNFLDNNDATNSDLDGEMVSVTLRDIEDLGGMFRLNGPYASVFPANSFDQPTSNFNFTRDQEGFEATMCYYYLDKSMRYINEDVGISVTPAEYTGGVRYDPIVPGQINAFFFPSTGQLTFGDGVDNNPDPPDLTSVDAGEDAFIISHELGHGIHHWLTGENNGNTEGLTEGLADYWGATETRDCGDANVYDEWQEEYHATFHWGLMPAIDILNVERTTNFTQDYCTNIGGQPNSHASGQWISTALVRIFSDLGKFKTDQLLLETMPLLTTSVNLQQAGAFLFQTAEDLNYSKNDLCIIYSHLDAVLCISQPPASVAAPTGNLGNVYMKDTQCDNGEEVNPDNGPMWLSEDIWVRHDKDGGLEHQNPEFKQNSPNWVYVRIRGIGCNELNNAQLRLYFSKASTGLTWPTMWDNFYLMGPNGLVLAGDEITTTPIDIPVIEPGEEWITAIEWYPPNPADFNTDIHHYCLLGRIISQDDPMFIDETSSVNSNTRNNNNIAWKNISVFDNDPNNIVGPISVYLACEESLQGGHLEVRSAQNSPGRSIHEMGNVFVELTEPFKSEWMNGGTLGNDFTLTQEGYLQVQGKEFRIEGVDIENCNQYINIYFEPFNRDRFAAFDLVQFDNAGTLVGGERFEYRPERRVEQRSSGKPQNLIARSEMLELYPNPTSGMLNVAIKDLQRGLGSIEIFDLHGRKVVEVVPPDSIIPKSRIEVDVSHLAAGLYLLIARDGNGKNIDDLKFVKE